jgi:preprotein translocase subunit SecG
MKNYLSFAQILISILLIITILLQKRGSALGSTFGSSGFSYFTRRGIEKTLFFATCILSFLFVLFSLLNLVL